MQIVNTNLVSKISAHLLWEFDLNSFDYEKSKSIVIERVIERGNLKDWQIIFKAYGKEALLQVAEKSKQLSKKDQEFTRIIVNSSLLYAV